MRGCGFVDLPVCSVCCGAWREEGAVRGAARASSMATVHHGPAARTTLANPALHAIRRPPHTAITFNTIHSM